MKLGKKIGPGLTAVFIFAALFISPFDFHLPSISANSPQNEPVTIEADTIAYSDKLGFVRAQGDVRITGKNSVISSNWAEYNIKTGQGQMKGGVKAIMGEVALNADEVKSYNHNELIIASGSVVATRGADRLSGVEVEYRPALNHAVISAAAKIETPDLVLTAERMEAFLNEDKIVGTGSVRIVSGVHKIEATANKALYHASPKENAKIVLSGNARVVDGDNLLTGENLTVGLRDKSIDAQGGRPKLIYNLQ